MDVVVAGFGVARNDIALGSDGQGNTLVVLPDFVSRVGDVYRYDPFGTPLLIPGTDYHLYELSYDPVSQKASLYVDGERRITGYEGAAVGGGAQANNYGLGFAAMNYATANYALASLESGQRPVPTLTVSKWGVASLFGLLVGSGVWMARRRAQERWGDAINEH